MMRCNIHQTEPLMQPGDRPQITSGGAHRSIRRRHHPCGNETGVRAAANAHDVERHVGFYAHDSEVTLIFNGVPIVGWDAIRGEVSEGAFAASDVWQKRAEGCRVIYGHESTAF